MIHYQYLCFRIGAGDGFHWATTPVDVQTHPWRFLLARTEGEGDTRHVTAQIEIQFSTEQLKELAVQVQTLLREVPVSAAANNITEDPGTLERSLPVFRIGEALKGEGS